jgi:spartin
VEISLPTDPSSNRINVRQVSPQYTQERLHPAYASSSLVNSAVTASRLIVTTSGVIGSVLQSGAETFTQKVKPAPKPMTFTPTTHARVRKLNNISQSAATMSSKTVGQVTKYAQNVGATIAHKQRTIKAGDKDGKLAEGYKPGILNKSLIAFSTIADGIDQASRHLLTSTSVAATTVVGHRYGDEAREVARGISGGFKNVGLVYVDATGVSRKAVLKSVAKGMVVGRVKGSGDLIVSGNDGGVVTGTPQNRDAKNEQASKQPPINDGRTTPGFGEPLGYGNAAQPPAYGTPGVGEPLHEQLTREYFSDTKH